MTIFNIASYGNPQAAVNALQGAGGGKLYVPMMYDLPLPLVISSHAPIEIEGDGEGTGFNYTGSPNCNVLQIGDDTYDGDKIRISNLKITQKAGISNVTGIFIKNQGSPYLDEVVLTGLASPLWIVTTWAMNFNRCTFANNTGSIGFDPSTPANNAVLKQCKAFGNSAALIALYHGCNGLLLQDGDYENNPNLISVLGGEPTDIGIEDNDIESLTGPMISSTVPINGLRIKGNTFANSVPVNFGDTCTVNGLEVDENNLYQTTMTINAVNCPSYRLGYNNLQPGGSVTAI